MVGPRAVPAPWQVLVRMKVAALRHSLQDTNRMFWTATGGLVGLVLAGATVWAALGDPDLLAVALGLWMLGWIVGPLFAGGGDESLRPEYFTMLPLPRRTLSAGLVAAAFVGVAPLVALVALASVVVVGARVSVGAALVGVPAALLALACFVLASRLAVAMYALLLRVRSGAVLAGVVNAFVLAFTAQGWALVAAFVGLDVQGALGAAGRIAPSGWALVAVEAAGRGEWPLAGAAVGGLGVLAAALFTAWSALLVRRSTADRAGVVPRRRLVAHSARGAALAKELRTWSRDLLVGHRLVFSFGYGLAFCLMPLAVGWAGMAPWAGAVAAVMGGAMWASAYAVDGTAVWLTVMVPGAARIDVRARQAAFLLIHAPPVVLLSVLLTWWSGQASAWPLVTGVVPAVLGAAAGVGVLLGVVMAVPGTDVHLRSGNPLSSGDNDGESMGQVLVGLVLIVAAAVPAGVAAALWGWWGLLVGSVTGALAWWGLGALAATHLERRGPELLTLLRHGRTASSTGFGARPSWGARMATLSRGRTIVVWSCSVLGAVLLFPQGIVPMIFKIVGVDARAWFLALYLPARWQWPLIVVTTVLGLVMYGVVASVLRRPSAATVRPALGEVA